MQDPENILVHSSANAGEHATPLAGVAVGCTRGPAVAELLECAREMLADIDRDWRILTLPDDHPVRLMAERARAAIAKVEAA